VTVHNRWVQLCASLVAMIMIANLQYAWNLFVTPIQAGRGWALSDVQFAFTLFILFQTWVQPLDGWLVDRLGPRGFITSAGLLCGLGWAGMGYATSLKMLYVTYCAAGIGAAFVYSCCIGSALKWFKDQRGLAAGIIAAGFGGGTALFIPIIRRMIDSNGYQSTFITTGLLQGLVIVIVAQFLRHPSAAVITGGMPSARRASQASAAPTTGRQYTTVEILRTPRFYVMYAAFVLMATGGLLLTANQGKMGSSWGFSAATLTLAATFSPLANGTSRIFWGWVSDRLGREITMVVAFTLQAISLFLVVAVGQTSPTMFLTTIVLVYFTWGEVYSLFPSMSGDYFGTKHATSNYAVLYSAKGVASIIGPWCGAILFEKSGSWVTGLYGCAVMALIAAGLALRLRSMRASIKAPAGVPATA
jgi:MFS transporter, OFA family, oxalate/formate antiporter